LTPDGKALMFRGREESTQYEKMFGIKIPGSILADRLALNAQMRTVYSSYRPFGTSIILATHDHLKGLGLYMVEPSGQVYEYYGCASGRGKQLARNEIEKKNFREISVQEALPLVTKILLKSQEEMKDKKQEIELSILSAETNFQNKILDRAFVEDLTTKALEEIEQEQMEM
jgi:20S proteasome subunit alpha 7